MLGASDGWLFDGRKTKQYIDRFEYYCKAEGIETDEEKCESFAPQGGPQIWLSQNQPMRIRSAHATETSTFSKTADSGTVSVHKDTLEG